jgi:energy-dependent translational throttle protein EttA
MITGGEQPDGGALKVGGTVELAYVDQSRDALDGEKTVYEEISGGLDSIKLGRGEINARAYCSWFGFKGQRPAEEGEGALRRRAQPRAHGEDAAEGRQPDPARRAVERPGRRHAARAGGRAARVRRLRGGHLHDRWFLDRICHPHHGLRGREPGRLLRGQLQEYEADRKRRLGAEADQPHRIKYKKLVRS